MLDIFHKWYRRYLFEEESVLLLVLLSIALVLLMTIGNILAPVLAALVLAFLMQGVAGLLERHGVPKWLGVSVAYLLFISVFFGLTLGVFPLVWRQLVSLASEMPRMLEHTRQFLSILPARYPELITADQLNQMTATARVEIAELGQALVSRSVGFIPGILSLLVYMILIPMLVFFFLKDRDELLQWVGGFLPSERPLLRRIWGEMNEQFANYARGKVLEIIIVGAVSYASFSWLGLNYAALLGLSVGLSVIIPYIGAALVTLPVVMVGYFQWGLGSEFYTLLVVYLTIQVLDGNVLVPFLFSEAVNLHPVAILMAVLFFGGIWGFWGIFFAIPLATLIKAIINAWPTAEVQPVRDLTQNPME